MIVNTNHYRFIVKSRMMVNPAYQTIGLNYDKIMQNYSEIHGDHQPTQR